MNMAGAQARAAGAQRPGKRLAFDGWSCGVRDAGPGRPPGIAGGTGDRCGSGQGLAGRARRASGLNRWACQTGSRPHARALAPALHGPHSALRRPLARPRAAAGPATRACALPALLIALLAGLLAGAAAQPAWEPAKWNAANKYTANRVPAALLNRGAALYDGGSNAPYVEPLFPLVGYDVQRQCKGPAAKINPAAVKPGTCQYKPNADGTFSYWEKQPGDWLRLSNCYCYALDVFKGAWCQPGAASGVPLPQNSMTCAQLKKAVLADGAREVTRKQAMAGQPASGHYIAMMLRPQSSCNFARCQPDFHFVRKDANGLWSQKAGEAPATNKDAQGALIRDPQAAKLQGSYTQFCGYFHVEPAKMRIGTIPVPNMIGRGVDKWKSNGLAVSVEPLAYNEGVDAVDASADYAMLQQQQFALQRGGRKLLLA